jgi:DNA-binding NtrC family response regulator
LQKISVLIVTSRPEDIGELRDLLPGTPWQLNDVRDLEGAAEALRAAAVPMLLFDRDTADGCWQDAIRQLTRIHPSACVVLLSNVADQYLWDEVIQQGGFDVLTRPFKKDQVLSTFVFAYAQCRAPWPKIC